jgi:hypothetical protein
MILAGTASLSLTPAGALAAANSPDSRKAIIVEVDLPSRWVVVEQDARVAPIVLDRRIVRVTGKP